MLYKHVIIIRSINNNSCSNIKIIILEFVCTLQNIVTKLPKKLICKYSSFNSMLVRTTFKTIFIIITINKSMKVYFLYFSKKLHILALNISIFFFYKFIEYLSYKLILNFICFVNIKEKKY